MLKEEERMEEEDRLQEEAGECEVVPDKESFQSIIVRSGQDISFYYSVGAFGRRFQAPDQYVHHTSGQHVIILDQYPVRSAG